jgi:hypothetical protein
MSVGHWKIDVFQHSRDDPVFVKRDKYIKVSRNLTRLILLHVFTGLEIYALLL